MLAWLCRLRIAPSRTSPISAICSRDCAFTRFAAHNHPTRRNFISARQAGTSCLRIYPAVTDPGIKPISSMGARLAPRSSLPLCINCKMTIFACWMSRCVVSYKLSIYCRLKCTHTQSTSCFEKKMACCEESLRLSSSSCRHCI